MENELQVQKEKYNSDPKLRERKKIEYKKRKEESKVLELKEKKEYFRKSEIESVIYDIDRLKNSNSTYSCKKKWLIKCFDHYFNTYNNVPCISKQRITALVASITRKYSDIEEKIDKYAKLAKNQIASAAADGLTVAEFQKVLSRFSIRNHFKDHESIEVKWKDFFQNFEVRHKHIMEQVKESDRDKKWYKSLTKIDMIYKRRSSGGRTFDYYRVSHMFWAAH